MNIAICDDEQIYADEIKKHVNVILRAERFRTKYMCLPTGKRLLGAK